MDHSHSYTFVSLNSRLESNKGEEGWVASTLGLRVIEKKKEGLCHRALVDLAGTLGVRSRVPDGGGNR